MKRLVPLALFSIFLPLLFIGAQVGTPEDIISSGINIITDPELPAPNTEVVARLDSSTTDLDQSSITWSVNGIKVASGKGVRSISLITRPEGSSTVINVTVISPDGTYYKSLTLRGNTVDLLWQGETYTPPFYKGRALWSYQSRATVVAIPHVSGRTTSTLTFRWSKDGTVLGTSSGVGKDSLLVFDTILGLPQNITVDVMTDRNTVVASGNLTLTPIAPNLRVYENHPLLGFVFEKEVGETFNLKAREVTFSAFPFFFGTNKRLNDSLIYNWSTNGGDAKVGNEVTYRTPDGEGKSRVEVKAESVTQILQTANEDFLVQFRNENAI